MRFYFFILLLAGLLGMMPGGSATAQEDDAADAAAVIERAKNLNVLLDRLLSDSNHSSIHDTLDVEGDPLVEEALRLKASGEELLAAQEYLQAAIKFQAALDSVFQAIRAQEHAGEEPGQASRRLADAIASNDTFISTAERVVNGEPSQEAAELLAAARRIRGEADVSAAAGDAEAALQQLEESTRLAQRAIASVRDGKVIERRQ